MARILIVEDDRRISSLLADLLRSDHAVRVVDDGETAVATLTADRPDVVLLDVNLPGVSGLEVLKYVRAFDPRVPVIMITGTSDEVAITTALMRGAFAYIPKPFNVEYVKHLIAVARVKVS
ncbi:MAG: response regulator [Candidatus Rokubacteria bacterium]|nr:response regulator [Candidatus Rokubacteria bacterium]